MKKKDASKTATTDINLIVSKKNSGKNLFPEKLAKANKIISKLRLPLPA